MNDFANAADAPAFDADGIARRARRKRATAIAGIAAALIVAGGGTALATAVTNGSDAPKPATAATTPADEATDEAATILVTGSKFKIDLKGLSLDFATQQLLKSQLRPGTASEVPCAKNGKPGSVIAVAPHSPKTVSKGDTINLTLCAD
ncbi:PASTA domain-containing protein [Streptomyces sp. NPDC056652]|uniref:PASTA domain-containing protein n=1 Tax=Streptomyces sp. NPDC056652 TaxID=3345893 RepID=UPI003683F176